MAKYKSYDYSQSVFLPVSLENQLMPGTLEFAIHTLVEMHMDTSCFDERYANDETGCTAYNPKILLKIVLLAYSRGIVSSRKIERACRENVTFMALACRQCPDHSTIAAFICSMKDEILPLFRDVLLVCESMDLLGGTEFSLDGCKLPSNASREWSGTIKELKNKQEKIERKVKQLIQEQLEEDKKDAAKPRSKDVSERAKREEQIKRLKKKADRIKKWLKGNKAKIGKSGKEIKSNITDNESAKMMTSHGTIQGYNGQSLVDEKHQVIVYAEAFGQGQDFSHVPPMIDGAKENLKAIDYSEDFFEGKVFTADSNYHSKENLKKCRDEKLNAYIPDVNFRKRDKRFMTQERYKPKKDKRFTAEDFIYDKAKDQYICPNGKVLKLRAREHKIEENTFRRYAADERNCARCSFRARCFKRKYTKRKHLEILIGKEGGSLLSQEMIEKIDTDLGRKIYSKRLAIVEPVYANIRMNKRLDRFTLRGKIKVTIQWLLYCMVHNMEKIANCGFA